MTEQFGSGFEGLEERTLLAANVTATLVGNTLFITGDATEQDIEIEGDGINGHVSLDTNGQTLTVNGSADSDGYREFIGVSNIVVRTNGGDDEVDVTDVNLTGFVTINGGAGQDNIEVQSEDENTYIGGNLVVNGGLGNGDEIDVEVLYGYGLTIGGNVVLTVGEYGDVEIDTEGSGDLTIQRNVVMNILSGPDGYGDGSISSYGYGDISIGGSVVMNGGAGEDDLEIYTNYDESDITITGAVVMNGNGGDDYLALYTGDFDTELTTGSIVINGGAGDDYGWIGAYYDDVTVNGSVIMNGGAGDDELIVSSDYGDADVTVNGFVSLFGNAGNDELRVTTFGDYDNQDIEAFGLLLDGGTGNDTIEIISYGYGNTITTAGVVVQGGSGNDTVEAYGTTVLGSVAIFGGAGDDKFCAEDNDVLGNFFLNGGSGFDEAHEDNNFVGGLVTTLSIEATPDFCPIDPPV